MIFLWIFLGILSLLFLLSMLSPHLVVEYREEGSDMFEAMNEEIREETSQMVMRVRVRKEEEVKREQVAKVTGTSSDGTVNSTVRKGTKVGRNDPCPFGSGKKYKRCCGANEE